MKNTGSLIVCILLISSSCLSSQVIYQNRDKHRNFTTDPNIYSLSENNYDPFTPGEVITPPYHKQDFLINSHDGDYGTGQYGVRVAADSLGYTLFVWTDYRNGKKEIMAQFYDPDRNRIGENLIINESELTYNNNPVPAVNKKGDFVVVWLKDLSTLMGQRFMHSGEKVGANIEISRHSANTAEPGVAVNYDGSFIVMWASSSYSNSYEIYSKYVSNSGIPSNETVKINEDKNNLSSIGLYDNISVDSAGNYYLCWSSYSGTSFSKIFLQKLNYDGVKVGENILVSSDEDTVNSIFPKIETLSNGTSLILWNKWVANHDSYRVLKSDGSFSEEITLNDVWSHSPAASAYKDSIFLVLTGAVAQFRWINENGELLGEYIPLTGGEIILGWYVGRIITEKKGNIIVAFSTRERQDNNVYFQEYDPGLSPAGSHQKINDDMYSSDQRFPYVKFNKQGVSIVLWDDGRNGRRDLYAQVYDSTFSPVGENIKINDNDSTYYYLNEKCVETLADGTFIIAFSGSEPNGVFIQALTASGTKSGQNIKVGDTPGRDLKLEININSRDEIQICWYSSSGAWLKRYNRNLQVIFNEKKFMTPELKRFSPVSVSLSDSTIFSCWRYAEYNSFDDKIFGAFYDMNGKMINDFLIDSLTSNNLRLECANSDSDYVVVYNQGGMYKVLRAYSFNNFRMIDTLTPNSSYPLFPRINFFNYRKVFFTYNLRNEALGMYLNDEVDTTQMYILHNYSGIVSNIYFYDTYFSIYRVPNNADLRGDKLFFTFQGIDSPGKGIDILGNVRQITGLDVGPNELYEPPVINLEYAYFLDQNYPNPFNNKTFIRYSIKKAGAVKIYIYNILGQFIDIILDKIQSEGNYELEFNASKLSSGVFFYTLTSEPSDGSQSFRSAKKMILLK